MMTTCTISTAKDRLDQLISQTYQSHVPIVITGDRTNAVLLSEDDWNAIQETLYLISIPGMRDSIVQGMNTPLEECEEELDW